MAFACTHIFHQRWESEKTMEFWALREEMQWGVSTVFLTGQCWQPQGAFGAGGLAVPGTVCVCQVNRAALKSQSWIHSGHCQ